MLTDLCPVMARLRAAETAQILRGKLRAEHPSMSDEAIEQDVRRTIRDEVLGTFERISCV